jgi:hypothetical protein
VIRGILAVMTVAVLCSCLAVASGQEAMPAHAHAESGEHGLHDGHGFETAMDEDYQPVRSQNFLMWLVSCLGWKYSLLLPASALASFVLTGVLVVAGKGKATGSAMAFLVAMPFLIGLFGMFDGLISSFMVIAQSTTAAKPSELAMGIGTSVVTPLIGMLFMVPSYLLATAGLFLRSLKGDSK